MVIPANIYVALLHHPVYNKTGSVVSSAITNLDLHDIARISRTYGLGGYYVANPQTAQRELAERILNHWTAGGGVAYNPNRGEALQFIRVVPELNDAIADITRIHGAAPQIIATAAKAPGGVNSFAEVRGILNGDRPFILCFGTGWGLTREFIGSCDHVLEPIRGGNEYNHLPVRAAVAIILDRLLSIDR